MQNHNFSLFSSKNKSDLYMLPAICSYKRMVLPCKSNGKKAYFIYKRKKKSTKKFKLINPKSLVSAFRGTRGCGRVAHFKGLSAQNSYKILKNKSGKHMFNWNIFSGGNNGSRTGKNRNRSRNRDRNRNGRRYLWNAYVFVPKRGMIPGAYHPASKRAWFDIKGKSVFVRDLRKVLLICL